MELKSLESAATEVVDILRQGGYAAYFAGGWVRDFLLGIASDDIDVATSAQVSDIKRLFPKNIPVGVHFGIIVVIHKGFHFEVATFRKDLTYSDGRRPDGFISTDAEEDAQRRDFTINGLFYDPFNQQVIDYVGGQRDIVHKVIRAIGHPYDRFKEDRLRMIRAVRYAVRLNFDIEFETKEAIKKSAHELMNSVSVERVWQEFHKMHKFSCLAKGLLLMDDLSLLKQIFFDKELTAKQALNGWEGHDLPPVILILSLYPDSDEISIASLLDRLKVSNEERRLADFWIKARDLLQHSVEQQKEIEPYEWLFLYAHRYGDECVSIYLNKHSSSTKHLLLSFHKKQKKELEEALDRFMKKETVLQAKDLMTEGVLPGLKMGSILKLADRLSVNLGIHDKEELIKWLKNNNLI
ncbi:MAG: CCA tRNA nucleotidyltransferase [Rhabdochlamydiaceae bacterium]